MSSKDHRGHDLPFDTYSTLKTAITGLSIGLVVTTGAAVGLGYYAHTLYQIKRTPEIITYQLTSGSNQVVKIERFENGKTLKQSALLKEAFFSNYVLNREIVNHMDERDRYAKVKKASSDAEFTRFQSMVHPEQNPDSCFGDERCEREIEVKDAYPIKAAKNVYRVEFTMTNIWRGKRGDAQLLYATIQYSQSDEQINYKDRFLNLFGYEVIDYQLNKI